MSKILTKFCLIFELDVHKNVYSTIGHANLTLFGCCLIKAFSEIGRNLKKYNLCMGRKTYFSKEENFTKFFELRTDITGFLLSKNVIFLCLREIFSSSLK